PQRALPLQLGALVEPGDLRDGGVGGGRRPAGAHLRAGLRRHESASTGAGRGEPGGRRAGARERPARRPARLRHPASRRRAKGRDTMNHRTLVALSASLLIALLLPASFAEAQGSRIAMSEATAARQAQTQESARQTVQSLFERLCPGRCEIIQVSAVMGAPSPAAVIEPGFEDDAPQAYQGQVESLRVDILLDSTLPGAFRQSIPRMLRYRLQSLAP